MQLLLRPATGLYDSLWRYVPTLIIVILFVMFPLGYFESLRWILPPPKATHGFLKGLFLTLVILCVLFRQKLRSGMLFSERLVIGLFILSFVISAVFSMVPETSLLYLWYPLIAGAIMYASSTIRFSQQHLVLVVTVAMVLVTATFAFTFFSLLFRYEVTTLYYFLFLPHRANFLLDELRESGKYVSLGPYIMLLPLTLTFLIERRATWARKALAMLMYVMSVLTAVLSNNRIDVLVVAIQTLIVLWLIPRRLAVILLLLIIPVTQLGLTTTEKYFGFNLEERILRPQKVRDIETVEMRLVYWQNALRNFRLHPLVGTGPNTYNDVTDFPLRRYYDEGVKQYTVRQDIGIGVHNIFIERLSDTGLFGFLTFVVLLLYFARSDIIAVVKRTGERRTRYILFALSSWSWILYGITDNGYGAQGFVTFFFLRGLLHHL